MGTKKKELPIKERRKNKIGILMFYSLWRYLKKMNEDMVFGEKGDLGLEKIRNLFRVLYLLVQDGKGLACLNGW